MPKRNQPQEQQGQRASSQQDKEDRPARQARLEAEAEGNAASASSDTGTAAVATDAAADADADADADAAAGDARSRLSASPRATAGDDRSVASNVNIVIMPDTGTTLAAIAVVLSAARSGLGKQEADLLRSLAAQQERSNRELIEALQAIASRRR